jgi:hypothetical protein
MSEGVIRNFIGDDPTPKSVQKIHVCGPSLVLSEPHGAFLMQGITVRDPFHVVLEARCFARQSFGARLVGRLMLMAYKEQTLQDVPMWYTKRYLKNQVLVQVGVVGFVLLFVLIRDN